MSLFKKATRTQRKLRLAIFGPSGSGKTYTALRIAHGIGGSVALIDTENSASIYSGNGSAFPDWDIAPLEQPTIDNLLTYMEAAKDYKVLIIDSFSHAWEELLNEVGRIAKARYNGNTHAAWKDGNPKQEKLIKAILNFPGHLIVCMRSATEWVIEKDERTGKVKPQRVGLAPKQGKGIEYEFDMLIELNPDHFGNVIKSRFSQWQDACIEKPDEKFGKELVAWLQNAPEDATRTETATPAQPGPVDGWADEADAEQADKAAKADIERNEHLISLLKTHMINYKDEWSDYLLASTKTREMKLSLIRVFIFELADSKQANMAKILKKYSYFKGKDGEKWLKSSAELEKASDKYLNTIYGKTKAAVYEKLAAMPEKGTAA